MDKKFFCFFLFFFFIVLTMGCIDIGNGEEVEEKEMIGEISSTILIDGVERNTLDLISGQGAEIGLNIKNHGTKSIENVTIRMVGYLKEDYSNNETDEIFPNTEYYFNWGVIAPELGSGERISSPVFFRVCFDSNTVSYSDVITIPEGHGSPPTPYSTTSSDYLTVLYNIPPTRIISGRENRIVGEIIIRNIGSGSIDYEIYRDGLTRNTLRDITVELKGLPGAEIARYSGREIGDTIVSLDSRDEDINLLRLIRGHELRARIEITIPDLDEYQRTTQIGGLELDINHGYCIDTPSITLNLRG